MNNMLTPEQVSQIRQKSGLSPLTPTQKPDVTTSNFTGKYDYLKEKPSKPSKLGTAISNIKSDITKRGQELGESLYKEQTGELAKTDVGAGARLALRTGGAVAGSIGDIIFEGLKAISPDIVKSTVKKGIEKVAETDVAKNITQSLSSWAEKNPEAAKDLQNTIDIASMIPAVKGAEVSSKLLQKGAVKTAEVAGKVATEAKPLLGKTLSTAGAVGEKAGKTIMSGSLTPTIEQATKQIAYKAKTPFLTRLKQAAEGIEKAPKTIADVAMKYNLAGVTPSNIGIRAKRIATNLFENQVKPTLREIKVKAQKSDIFSSIQKEINKVKDISQRKSLQDAFESIAEDYKHVSSWNYQTLDKIKSEMAKKLPAKVWKGQDITGDANNIRKMFSDKARAMVREKLPQDIKDIYDDYGSLKELADRGAKGLTQGVTGGALSLLSKEIKSIATPLTTGIGLAVGKTGGAIKKLGQSLLK